MVECAGSHGPADKHEESMIRNIVFDLGNVLISFKPAEYLIRKNHPEDKRMKILADVFGSREWQMLDNGDITANDAIERICRSSSLSREEITSIFETRHEIFYPLQTNVSLLHVLKKAGYGLYFLSNFPADLWHHIRTIEAGKYDFFRYFDGGIISAEVRASKPDPGIYKIFLENYGLKAEECFYIDDLEINVQAALSAGMKGVVTHGKEDVRDLLAEFIIVRD